MSRPEAGTEIPSRRRTLGAVDLAQRQNRHRTGLVCTVILPGLAKVAEICPCLADRSPDVSAATAQMMMLADHHRVNLALAPTWDDDRILDS